MSTAIFYKELEKIGVVVTELGTTKMGDDSSTVAINLRGSPKKNNVYVRIFGLNK